MYHSTTTSYPSFLAATLLAFCLLLASGCGGNKPYKIDGVIEGIGTQNITAIYHDGTALKVANTNAVNSAFHLEGIAEQPVVIEFFNNQRQRIGCVAARNGEEITVKFKVSDPYFIEASGNELTASLAEFLKKNSASLNDAIYRQISNAPDADLSVLLATYYYDINPNPLKADSLFMLFDNKTIAANALLQSKAEIAARLAKSPGPMPVLALFSNSDTITDFAPSTDKNTLYIFTDANKMPDSIVAFADSMARELRVASIRLSLDSFGWHNDCRRFSKKVVHLWALGGVANPQLKEFNLPRVPFFIIADTTAHAIYRGSSMPKTSK